VILSHGDIITRDAKPIVAQAWGKFLRQAPARTKRVWASSCGCG
jgi:hypothetical protein